MTEQQGTRFFKPEEVAKILNLSRDTVMRAIRRRELGAVKFSSRLYRVMDFQLSDFQHRRRPMTNREAP